ISAFLFLVAMYAIYRYWSMKPRNFPPGPTGLPVFGVLPYLGMRPEQTFNKWKKTYGPVMGVRMSKKDWVVLGDHSNIKLALLCEGGSFSGRPTFNNKGRKGIAFLDFGRKYNFQRSLGLLVFSGNGLGKNSLEQHVRNEAPHLIEAVRGQSNKPFDIENIVTNAVFNTLSLVVYGQRFEYSDQRFTKIFHQLSTRFHESLPFALTNETFAGILKTVFTRRNSKKRNMENLEDNLLHHFLEHKNTMSRQTLRGFVDAFLSVQDSGIDSSYLVANSVFHSKVDQLIHYISDLFICGTITTAGALRWALLCLLHHPDKQDKMRREIIEVLGDKDVTMLQKADLPYTSAFIHEVCRYRTIFPLGLPHKTSYDVLLDSYFIPQGTTVCINLWGVHNDPCLFDEPGEFRPERHLYEDGKFGRSDYVIPFSVGPRHCLGHQVASMMLFSHLVNLMRNFEFLPDPTDPNLPDITNGSSGILFLPRNFKLVAKA
uniref:Uncharacterized protein n=1 Tax=Ciona savignyi TaxID=51511 RepID=H2YCW7_CIOSA